jgi:hypothetical protein
MAREDACAPQSRCHASLWQADLYGGTAKGRYRLTGTSVLPDTARHLPWPFRKFLLSIDLDSWLWQRRGWFLGARHFLSHESIELLRIERLLLKEFPGDFLQLVAMCRQ